MNLNLEIPEHILHNLLDPVPIPPLARVRHDLPTPPALMDVTRTVMDQLRAARLTDIVQPGQRIALAVGSRGVSHLAEIVAATVRDLRACGADPFIIPSMGSHGGATAEGQREVLAHLGVTAERAGAPVESQMDTVLIGRSAGGAPVYMDRLAAEADGIVVINRIKPHTAFRGPYESGLAKMIAIGLGKQPGAAATHARGFGEMARMVPEMAAVALANAPIRLALGILENARDQPCKIVALPAGRILAEEPALLAEARAAMPRLPFDRFDVLVIDRIGKNISGDGADPNITGRYPTPYASGGPEVNKQVVLDLTGASSGNANGIGTADYTTLRLARKMDLAATYPNALTSTVPGPVALPMILPSDRLAIAAGLLTCNAVDREPRLVRIQDTLHLDELWVSPALLDDVSASPHLSILSGLMPLSFDPAGNLPELNTEPPEAAESPIPASARSDAW